MPPTGNRSGLASHHARPTRACGTGTTIEEVDEHSSPRALTIMTTSRMTTPGTGSGPADFHPHPTITYTGPTPTQCDSKYIRLRALHLAMMYLDVFATNRGGSHATDSRDSSAYALWKPGWMPRSIRFATGGTTSETRTQRHGSPLPHTH